MTVIHRAVLFSGADKYATHALTLGTLAVMSRILTPVEVGIYLLANTAFLLADNLRCFGVGIYIVQAPELRRESLRSAFTITLLVSLGVAASLNLLAAPIAGLYGEPELAHLLAVGTLSFLWVPFATPIVAKLQRDMAFGRLAWLNLGAAVVNAGVTIGLGLAGAGPISYIWGSVAASATLAGLAIFTRPDFGIFRPSLSEARRILSFGAVSATVTMINLAYDLLPRLAFGKILGFDAVGIYARAVTICQLPDRVIVSALQPVVLPAMAARSRAGGDLKTSYLRGLTLMSAIQWPMLVMLALLADPVVRILLGPQWGETAPLVRMIALATMALAPAFMTFPVLVTVGRIRDTLISSLISLPPSIFIVIGAATLGLWQVAASMFVVAPLQMFVALLFVRRAIDMSWKELFVAAQRSAAMAVGTAALPSLVLVLSPNGFALSLGDTVLAILGGGVGWLAALLIADHPLKAELASVWRTVRVAASRRKLVKGSPAE